MSEKQQRIADLIVSRQLDEAEKELGEMLAAQGDQQPESSCELLYLRGFLAERRHEWERCIEVYEQVLAIDAEHTETLFRLAYVCDLQGEDERALELYERCTRESPAHVNALMNMAVLYEDYGRYDEALECVECVLDQYPNHARARMFEEDLEASGNMYYDEDQERLREKHDAVLDTPISDFELSVRSRNCLKQMNIRTLGDLLSTTEQELLAYKNFGETSLNEIKIMLGQKGLALGQPASEAVLGESSMSAGAPRIVAQGDPVVLQRPVGELELSVRSRKCLQRLGVSTVGELAACSETELLAIKNFRQTSLVEIRRQLADVGLGLRA